MKVEKRGDGRERNREATTGVPGNGWQYLRWP